MLINVVVLFIVGHFVSQVINKTNTDKQDQNLENNFRQLLGDNEYGNFHPDMEIANRIFGLQMQKQIHIPNIKPRFYFQLDKKTGKTDVYTFLSSLPNDFLVNVPALTISIEDSKQKSIFFWKNTDHFQLAYKQDNYLILLSRIRIEELAERIFFRKCEF